MDLSNLKSLVKERIQSPFQDSQKSKEGDDDEVQASYEDWGFKKASDLRGSMTGLLSCLARVREDHKRKVKEDELKQHKRKEPLVGLRETKLEEIQHREEEVSILKRDKEGLEEEIQALKKEAISIRKNPQEIIPDKMSKVSFFIGLTILVVLSVYLFVFYSSASFSAFFKTFTLSDVGTVSSIFDAEAITKAYEDGVTELILILSMPFVFIGLGFLIHKFQELEGFAKFLKIGFLIAVTFLFDAILAYEITEKIYNIKVENLIDGDVAVYSVSMAYRSVNFWLIIFAGFIVYLIWGFVFDFTIESYDKINVVKQAIKAKESEIELCQERLAENESNNKTLCGEINKLKIECKSLKNKIEGVIIDTTEFDRLLHQFLGGWLHWMSANKMNKDIEEATQKANEFIEENVKILETNNLEEL